MEKQIKKSLTHKKEILENGDGVKEKPKDDRGR